MTTTSTTVLMTVVAAAKRTIERLAQLCVRLLCSSPVVVVRRCHTAPRAFTLGSTFGTVNVLADVASA